jgi:RHS repeat-associated protein
VFITTVIDYAYDPLYRLIAADYDSGQFFHYGYDAVGNRLLQETHNATNVYAYDAANRLVEVDGVAYNWDANGNLLDDGERTYTYYHANRLTALSDQGTLYTYAYNGLGDRLQQSVDGVVSDYTLDIEAGLTQVLSDGEEAFLYGVGRIAQQGLSSRNYFLGDVLSSTRQLVDDAGRIGLGKAYEPFGDLLLVAGELETSYGFAGEWTDATGLIHLRARYYLPTDGRFVQPDPFAGIPTQPISQNPYLYAYDNPLAYTNPSGQIPLALTTQYMNCGCVQ